MNADRTESRLLGLSFSERVTSLRMGTSLLFLVLLFCIPAWAQPAVPARAPAAASEAPEDALGRSTPRGSVLGFLTANRKGDSELAAQYLNTRLRGKAAANLAQQLFVVLDRRLPAGLNEISDHPEGSQADPLKPDQELVGTIVSDDRSVEIFVERVDRGKSGPKWLFSSETLDSIPELYAQLDLTSVDKVLPEFLVKTQVAEIPLFQWLAVFVGMPLFYFFTALLNRVLSHLVDRLRRRFSGKPHLATPEVLPKPIRLLLLALLIRWLLGKLSLPLLPRQFWFSTSTLIAIAGCAWLLILLNNRAEEYIAQRLQRRNYAESMLMLRLAGRVVDGLIIFAGLLVALYHFGVKPTAALAGLGVGGIAIALAAQKTLENVIAGISLIFDRTVSVGDTLKVGETLGTVVDIGLRSTRIRTLDRSLVSVPNGQIANMTLENLSARDKFLFHPMLRLNYGTTSSQMHTVLDRVGSLLEETQHLEHGSVRVRFLRFGSSSLDVEIIAYIAARDWNHFLEIQGALLLRIMEYTESIGIQMALPSQAIFVAANSTSTDAGIEGLLDRSRPDNKTGDQAAARSA